MKTAIHPKWNHTANVICACGNTFTTGSTKDEIRVDICSACHPFYTGSMKFVDIQGRVDRFEKLRAFAAGKKTVKTDKKKKAETQAPLTLREMMEKEKKSLVTA